MRRLDDPLRWFIIDWSDAGTPPTSVQPHFQRSTHSPNISIGNHGGEVDIWGVGGLIIECEATFNISSELQDLGRLMQSSAPPSAEEALRLAKGYHLPVINPSSKPTNDVTGSDCLFYLSRTARCGCLFRFVSLILTNWLLGQPSINANDKIENDGTEGKALSMVDGDKEYLPLAKLPSPILRKTFTAINSK